MITNFKYNYPKSIRSLINEQRHYDIETKKLPSVTTILAQTLPADKKNKLEEWKKNVGEEQANRIKNEAANRGTAIHTVLEKYLLGEHYLDLTDTGHVAHKMGQKIIEDGLKDKLIELHGSEATLHYRDQYAGSTDVVGLYKNKEGQAVESILDFKQSNKVKLETWIGDYFLQLAGYILAHNDTYKSNIQQGVILMCTPKLEFQRFILDGDKLKRSTDEWLKRVELYYKLFGNK
jgi:genome maintenance exonuclease 1